MVHLGRPEKTNGRIAQLHFVRSAAVHRSNQGWRDRGRVRGCPKGCKQIQEGGYFMKSMSDLLSDWRTARTQMEKVVNNLPRIIGNESVRVVKENFKLQGYDSGSGVKPWDKRADDTNKNYDHRYGVKGSVYNSGSPILMQTRNLYNSIKYSIIGKNVIIGVDLTLVPYGEKMNEGGSGTWGKHAKTDTPARQYMPTPNEPPNIKILNAVGKKVKFESDKAMSIFKR